MPLSKKANLPDPWPGFLSELDILLPYPVEIRCLGAFLLTAVYAVPRFTGDLDCLEIFPSSAAAAVDKLAGRNSRLASKHRVWVQHVGTGIVDLPEDYERRLEPLDFGFEKLQLSALEVYDLVLSKLTRNSPKDREDVKFIAQHQNLSLCGRLRPKVFSAALRVIVLVVLCRLRVALFSLMRVKGDDPWSPFAQDCRREIHVPLR